MKKKAIQTLIFLNSRSTSKLDSNNVHEAFNHLPKANHIDLKQNAKRYATAEMQSNYGIVIPQPMTKEDKKTAQQIINKINQIKRTKSIRLAGFIERIAQRINYEELQEARQFLQTLNKKEIKEMTFTLDTLGKVVNEKLERQEEFFENHTLKSAYNLIQELKKTKKMDEL